MCFAGVKSVSIDLSKEEVLVETALTSTEVQSLIESTGRRAVLKGIGGSEQGENDGREKNLMPLEKKKREKLPQMSTEVV